MKNSYRYISLFHGLIVCLLLGVLTAQPRRDVSPRVMNNNDVYHLYTSVGQIGLTVTNFGVLGNGWNKINGRIHPSCAYKQHSQILRENIEHFSFAGLWIGGIVNGEKRVSTAIVDGVFESGQEGFEFFSKPEVRIRSSISSTSQDSMAQYYSPHAVSHQDFLMNFKDYGATPDDDIGIPNHTPLGIDVHLESYAWNFSFADAFVILNYEIVNSSNDTIKDLFAGIWTDASIGNMNYTSIYEPGGGFTWYDNLDGFDESMDESGFARDIGYQYDADGDDGWSESYLGIACLGGTVPREYFDSYYHQWVWTNSNNSDYPAHSMPLRDDERYEKMKTSVPKNPNGINPPYGPEGYPATPNSWLFMLSAGPLGSMPNSPDSLHWALPPGDTCHVVFTTVAGLWAAPTANSPARRENLHINKDWAQKAYDGEDKNRDNILNDDEDINQNGILDRYILPEPPPVPNMTVKVEDQSVTLFWQKNAETFIDPISHEMDFEGYRVYGARKTNNGSEQEFTLLGEFDKQGNSIGYNTGFDVVQIMNDDGEPDSLFIDGNYYHYRFANSGVQNGWLNYYAVTAFDRGDPGSNLASLESNIISNRKYVYPGQVSPSDTTGWTGFPTVYPNPFRGQAAWDGYGNREQMIWFQNLPSTAEIRIFTLAGDLVKTLHHDEKYQGRDIRNIDHTKNPVMSGGEHAWDLITEYDQAAASGLYLFTVEDLNTNKIKEGKFLIIK